MYSGKFLYGANFRIFRMLHPGIPYTKIKKLQKFECMKIFPLARHL